MLVSAKNDKIWKEKEKGCKSNKCPLRKDGRRVIRNVGRKNKKGERDDENAYVKLCIGGINVGCSFIACAEEFVSMKPQYSKDTTTITG